MAAFTCPAQQSKEMLREEADLLGQLDRNLFGKKFSEPLVASTKFAEKGKKTKKKTFQNTPSEASRSSSGVQHSKFFLDRRFGKSRQKILDGNYRLATGRNSGFQGKSKYKENLLQHVFSTCNSNRRSEKSSSMGKKLVLCKNNSKLATSREVNTFLEAWKILTKDPENLEIVKGVVQDTFSKISNIGASNKHSIHL